ncbi:MAG: hypothetical protein JRD93_12620 [Deltaproteobacteria bacterium]|nr:hypothetical protein [Deltaproteobacteria bacterium]
MQLNLKMLEDKVKKVEAEVVDLREVIRTAISQEVDLDELASSIVSHAVTEEDSTEILMKIRRQGEDWCRQSWIKSGINMLRCISLQLP